MGGVFQFFMSNVYFVCFNFPASQLLANMEFRPTDHASEKQLKLDVIAIYNHRLDERERRKKFVVEHNLLDYKKQPPGAKKRLKVTIMRLMREEKPTMVLNGIVAELVTIVSLYARYLVFDRR